MTMPTEKPAASGICDWCRELCDTVKFCGQCKIARYCSPECQKRHWTKHSEICHASKEKKTCQSIELFKLIAEIAFHLAIGLEGDALPADLYTPIVRKQKKSESEFLIYLEEDQDLEKTQEILPSTRYDKSAANEEESVKSWSRMYSIGFGTLVNRAAALAINTALMLDRLQLTVAGSPITALSIYKAESRLPMWSVMRPSDSAPGEYTAEPQEREHMWLGFRVQQADSDKVTDDVFFVDFTATSWGIFDTVEYDRGQLFAVAGWASELRRSSPHLYRNGNIYRNQDYLNRYSQLWPEIKETSPDGRGPSLAAHHRILSSKVERVEQAIEALIKE